MTGGGRAILTAEDHARNYPRETVSQHDRRYAAMAKKNATPSTRPPRKPTDTDLKYLAWKEEKEAAERASKHKKKPV